MRFLLFSLIAPSLALAPSQPVLQQPAQTGQAEAVKEAFQHAWDGYSQYAFPHDELHPVNNGYGDSRFVATLSQIDCTKCRD